MSEEASAKQEAVPEKKKEAAPVKIQTVYRLPNGEWVDFAEAETISKEKFYRVFHRQLQKDGELICETEYDEKGNEVQKTINTFDDKGRIVLHELFNDGMLAEKSILEYDEK